MMFIKKIKFILIIILFYQSPLYSKSTSFKNIDSKNLSNYFSGIVAFENNNNTKALSFFNSSKSLLNKHEPYLKRYIYSLVLDNKVSQAINLIKRNKGKNNVNFFDAHLLLILDSLNKDDLNKADFLIQKTISITKKNRFNSAVLENLKQYIDVFNGGRIINSNKKFGKLSAISETFQRCYLGHQNTDLYFHNLYNDPEADYTRYIFFHLTYLIENKRIDKVKKIISDIDYINSSLLLSQGKNWIESGKKEKLTEVFSCKNYKDIIGEFLFLISNLYSSQDDFEKSNFYLNLSNFLNSSFIYNLSLVAENQYLNNQYKKAKKTLKNFKKDDNFYYWFRVKKEAQIIAKQENRIKSIKYITSEFDKIIEPSNKILFDLANFYKNSKKYKEAIKYYTEIIDTLNEDSEVKSDLLYRRGSSYERIKKFKNADKDLLNALKINPEDAYILNYLAYSWLERDYKIDEAIQMLETAYELKNDDPYIIDSIGWAYYLIDDYLRAEKFLKRAVELMPDDPIVNDHYGDILWKLDRKIQARYFWATAREMENAEEDMIKIINIKMLEGLKKS